MGQGNSTPADQRGYHSSSGAQQHHHHGGDGAAGAGDAADPGVIVVNPAASPSAIIASQIAAAHAAVTGSASLSAADLAALSSTAEIQALHALPTFLPILRSAIDNNWYLSSRDFESVDVQLESSAIMTLASRTQQHFAHLADRVSSEQNAIDESIRRTEVVTARASAALAQRQKNATRMAGAAAEIQSMIKTLTSLQAATQRLSESCRQLNALLPESVQEPLNGPSPTSVFAATASSLASPVPTSTPSSGSAPVRRQLIPPAIGIDLYFDGSSPRSPSKSQRSSAAPSPAPKVIDRASPVPEATPPEAPPVPPSPAPSVADDPIVFDELKEALSSNMQE